uniref:Uncharacterized protein n=1 Tax=Plectus sambesii TaxID=2011161 RepID=A0A914UYR4_9BILA
MRRLSALLLGLIAAVIVHAEIIIQHPTARLQAPSFKDKQHRDIVTAQMMQALHQLKERQHQLAQLRNGREELRSTRKDKDNGDAGGDRQPLRFGKRQVAANWRRMYDENNLGR